MGYAFDPDVLHGLVRAHLDAPFPARIDRVVDAVAARYPAHVVRNEPWLLNNAGGAMGMMKILHASPREYLIVFGSPIGTEGHTGRFRADDYFMVLYGEQWAYTPGELEKRVYRPGDLHHLPRGTAGGYRFPDACFALEYARGSILSMLPFGFADTLSSTLDLPTLAATARTFVRLSAAAAAVRLRRSLGALRRDAPRDTTDRSDRAGGGFGPAAP